MDRPAPDCASLHPGYGPSLRAKRSNPALSPRQRKLDCFVASLLAMTGKERTLRYRFARRANRQQTCLASFAKISFWNCGNYGDTKFFFHACKCTARRQHLARMQRSEIRGNAANGSTGPGLRFAPSRLRAVIASEATHASFAAATKQAGFHRRGPPRNDGERANLCVPLCPTRKSAANPACLA